MSTRDTTPYLEDVHTLPDGTKLFAAQNLTADMVDLIRKVLKQRRTTLTLAMVDTDANSGLIIHGLIEEARDIDHLLLSLYHIRHQE